MYPSLLTVLGAPEVAAPSSPLAWLPYVVALVTAIAVLRKMPNENAQTVGQTMTLAMERLDAENERQRQTIADLRADVQRLENEVDELRHELRHREDTLAELVPDPLDEVPPRKPRRPPGA